MDARHHSMVDGSSCFGLSRDQMGPEHHPADQTISQASLPAFGH